MSEERLLGQDYQEGIILLEGFPPFLSFAKVAVKLWLLHRYGLFFCFQRVHNRLYVITGSLVDALVRKERWWRKKIFAFLYHGN